MSKLSNPKLDHHSLSLDAFFQIHVIFHVHLHWDQIRVLSTKVSRISSFGATINSHVGKPMCCWHVLVFQVMR